MARLFERRLMCVSFILTLASAPGVALATTVHFPGGLLLQAAVWDTSVFPVDLDEISIEHDVPSSASVAASGSEISTPNPQTTYSTVSGTVSAGLEGYVLSVHWSGVAHMTQSSYSSPFAAASSGLYGNDDILVFDVSEPTPITLSARGSAAGPAGGSAASRAFLFRCEFATSCNVTYLATIFDDGSNFNRRFSTTLDPGIYGFTYYGSTLVSEYTSGEQSYHASASLDIVMTLSPVGDCSDGLDNDGDTLADLDDANCEDGTDASEAPDPPVPTLGAAGRATIAAAVMLAGTLALRSRSCARLRR